MDIKSSELCWRVNPTHPRWSCKARRSYGLSVNVCVTSARPFLDPKIVVRVCRVSFNFLGTLNPCYAISRDESDKNEKCDKPADIDWYWGYAGDPASNTTSSAIPTKHQG